MRISKREGIRRFHAELDRKFNEYHEAGSKEFGYEWLAMNRLMVGAATGIGVRPEEQPFKTLLTLCALRTLNHMQFMAKESECASVEHPAKSVIST